MLRALCFLLLLAWMPVQAVDLLSNDPGARVLAVHPGIDQVSLGPYLEYYVDESRQLGIGEVSAADFAERFADLPGDAISFGYSYHNYWFRFEMENVSENDLHLYIEARYPLIDSIRVFLPDGAGGFSELRMGDTLPYGARPLNQHHFTIPLSVPAGERQTYYMEVHTTSSFDLPLVVSSETAYIEHVHDTQMVVGLFYGVIFGLLAYNLFIYMSTREKAFLLYVLYLVGTIGYNTALDGIQFRMFPGSLVWAQYAVYVCINVTTLFMTLFSIEVLSLRDRRGWLLKSMQAIAVLNGIAAVMHLGIDITITARVSILLALLSFIMQLVAGVVRMRDGYKPARIYVLAFVVFLALASLTVLSALGIIPVYEFSRYGLKLSMALQLILLSLSLGDLINQLKEEQFEIKQEVIKAHAHSQASSEFLAKMSHEIRTPMNGVLGMAELMGDTRLDRIQSHYLNVITSSGRALRGVINDILDYSKIEAGKMEIEHLDCNLEELLNECVSVFSLKADEKNLEFVLSIEEDAPLQVRIDPTRVRQVVLNLLGNAFKFTDRGHVMVRVCHEAGDEQPFIRIEVADSGIGIPQEVQRNLFSSFTQADVSTTRKYGGTGLGLAICKQLVELMGGAIGIESQAGHGSVFWFRLPAVPASRPASLPAYRKVDLQDLRVLLVSELSVYASVMQQELARFGARVDVAEHSRQAVARVRDATDAYHVIAIDKELPGESGYALARELHDLLDPARTRLVLVTGLRDNEKQSQLDAAGIAMAINRPLSSAQMRDALALTQRSLPRRAPPADRGEGGKPPVAGEAATPAPAAGPAAGDFSHLRVLVADDNQVNLMVAVGMLGQFGIHPETASDGSGAVAAVTDADAPFDLVFMDCEMPGMDGYDATRAIRAHLEGTGARTVIIALSAHVMAEARRKSLDAGMDDHMAKPLNRSDLQQKLLQWGGS